MKTIEVSDEMFDKLKGLADEYVTQDNRSTAKPYLFQIQTVEEHVVPEDFSDKWIWSDGDGGQITTEEEIKEIIMEFQAISEEQYDEDYSDDEFLIEHVLNKVGYQKYWVRDEFKYQNAFFTAKACKEHIERNHYHYNEPVDYLNHSWRNPEMGLISDFLIELSKKDK